MKTAGIICECNPLHAGHLYLVEQARRSGADAVVCVMSGCFVQRGEAAVLDPYARAEMLIRSGADAVLELPFPFSASGAEFFGKAGVEILSRLGVDELWFGTECGDLERLSALARAADDESFIASYIADAAGNLGTAKAYFNGLQNALGGDVACSPNDILAISYLRAITALNSNLRPVTVKRRGSGYAETDLHEGMFPSATALRLAWLTEGSAAILPFLPHGCGEILLREEQAGHAPASINRVAPWLLGTFRLTPTENLEAIAGLGGGLAGRMKHAALQATSAEDFYALCATKKYTNARVRRGALMALAGVKEDALRQPIAYVRLLAADPRGCAFLSAVRKRSEITVVTRQTDLPQTPAAKAQFSLEERETALYSLCLPTAQPADALLRRTPLILSDEKK
ncbi:MAG: nucleotidyltransferase family protein [Clostridia bacterium]|nr:nucleotidyltransferase family protein [Clostridia bacterium]